VERRYELAVFTSSCLQAFTSGAPYHYASVLRLLSATEGTKTYVGCGVVECEKTF
jgi:hypothetical protein